MLQLFLGLLQLVSLIFIFTFHNYIRAFTAVKLGDDTPKRKGFLTINPLPHIDPIGTILLPAFFILLNTFSKVGLIIGWPRPVPINFYAFKDPKKGAIILAVVGIFAYFLIGFLSLFLYKFLVFLSLPANISIPLITLFQYSTLISFFFGFINLIPIPPMDMGNLVFLLMGKTMEDSLRFSVFGSITILFLFLSGLIGYLFEPFYRLILSLF
jgi:Zn-dependent protease